MNGDNLLYYSDGTTAGSKATAYVFGNDVFSNPDFGVFSHDDKHTALGTNKAPHDIIIFKDKSSAFDYVEKAVGAFNGMVFHNGKLYYLFASTGNTSKKLMEYEPVSKLKRELLSFDSNGAYGLNVLNGKLVIIGYKNGNSLLSVDPESGVFTTIYKFNATNTTASAVNMLTTEDKLYFWYPNGTSSYSLYVTKGTENSTISLLDNLDKFDPFVYYAYNVIKAEAGKLIARVKVKNDFNNTYVYFSDGTLEGTNKIEYNNVKNFDPYDFEYYCGRFFFRADDEKSDNKLFSTDGRSGVASKLSDLIIGGIVKFNNKLFINAEKNFDRELYTWDEKTAKIILALDINKMARESDPREMTATRDKLFMVAIKSNVDLSYNLAVMTEPTRISEECLNSSVLEDRHNSMTVFPNPFDTGFLIDSEDPNLQNYSITITDLTGKVILNKTDLSLPIKIITTDWNPGMYIAKIANENVEPKSIRLIKTQ